MTLSLSLSLCPYISSLSLLFIFPTSPPLHSSPPLSINSPLFLSLSGTCFLSFCQSNTSYIFFSLSLSLYLLSLFFLSLSLPTSLFFSLSSLTHSLVPLLLLIFLPHSPLRAVRVNERDERKSSVNGRDVVV